MVKEPPVFIPQRCPFVQNGENGIPQQIKHSTSSDQPNVSEILRNTKAFKNISVKTDFIYLKAGLLDDSPCTQETIMGI